jgi:hypothetical protein
MFNRQSHVLGAMISSLAFVLAAASACAITTQVPVGRAVGGHSEGATSNEGPPLPSNFDGPLWQVVAPQGGTATVAKDHLYIHVPGGSNHDALRPANQAVRVVQAIGNQDFDISIKLDSLVDAANRETSQGLMVLADDKDFLTFALTTDGTRISLGVHSVSAGVASTVFDQAGFSEYQNPMYLRLNRTGSDYVGFYSVDGVVWTQATAFTSALAPAFVGPFAGNFNDAPSRAVPFVMAIHWFDIL